MRANAASNDGPFRHPDDYGKLNAVLRYSQRDQANGISASAMLYRARWNSTDQIPQRAIDSGFLADRFSTLDTSDGGSAQRYSLSGEWHRATETAMTKVNAYLIGQQLKLFSNFNYFLDDPVNGDQFSQPDRRTTSALNASHAWQTPWGAGVDDIHFHPIEPRTFRVSLSASF